MASPEIVLDGLLKADGTVQLDALPRLPPGRVRVTLQRLEETSRETTRLPDPPWIDESLSAPCDLPRPAAVRIEPRTVTERLPQGAEALTQDEQ
jgi:hypothetical protein